MYLKESGMQIFRKINVFQLPPKQRYMYPFLDSINSKTDFHLTDLPKPKCR